MAKPGTFHRELQDIEDIQRLARAVLKDDLDALDTLSVLDSPDAVYRRIDESFTRQNSAFNYTIGVDGIVHVLRGVAAIVEQAGLVPQSSTGWESVLWGSLALALDELSPDSHSANDRIIGLLEDLTTTNSLPGPPLSFSLSHDRHLQGAILQLFAELSCGLARLASFLRTYPHDLVSHSETFKVFDREHQKTIQRLSSWSARIRNCQVDGKTARITGTGPLAEPYRSIPVHCSKYFRGRDDCLRLMRKQLRAAAEQPAILSIYGLPGIGKTQLAARYCRMYIEEYRAILWISADTPEKLLHDYTNHAVSLRLEGANPLGDSSTNTDAVLSWLKTTPDPWLAIFDNVDDVGILHDYCPSAGAGHIIITSRNPYTAGFRTSASLNIPSLTHQESVELFYEIIGEGSEKQHNTQIENLFSEWNGVPLALNQIGSYIRRAQLDLGRFGRLYSKDASRFHKMRNAYEGYSHSIATAFSIQQLGPEAKAVLQGLCYFDPDKIPNELIGLCYEGDALGFNSVEDEFDYLDALDELRKGSLLLQHQNDISVHRLVQTVVFANMAAEERMRAFDSVLSLLCGGFPRETEGKPMWQDWEKCGRYLPHVLFLCGRWQKECNKGDKCPKLAELLSICTWFMFERGYFLQAETLLMTAQEACPDSENPVVATILFNLAGIRCECNRIAEAIDLCSRALKIREAILAPDDPLLGNTYYSMGIVYMEGGRLQEALDCHNKSLHVRELRPDRECGPTAFTYGNLALCYQAMGELDEASKYMEAAEALWKEACGTKSDKYGQVMYYLGNLRLAQNKHEEALRLHTISFDICCEVLPNHFKTGFAYHKMATFFHKQGRFDEALLYLRNAISIFEKSFDPNPRIARSMFRMSEVLEDMGNKDEAVKKRGEANRIRRTIKTFPYNPGETADAYDSLIPSFLR